MAATADARNRARRIERERRRLELIGIRDAARIGRTAEVAALKAWRAGKRSGFGQIIAESLGEFSDLMRTGMTASHLSGMVRAVRDFPGSGRRGLQSDYDETIVFAASRLALTDAQVAVINSQYSELAAKTVAQIAVSIDEGLSAATTLAEARTAAVSGFGQPGAAARAQTLFRTQVQTSFGAGRWDTTTDPAVSEILWGFEYVAILDDRVRPEHETLDGMRRPKDDPAWDIYWPPNGWNCRCTALEIYAPDQATDIPADAVVDPGFDFNAGKVFSGNFVKAI